MYLEDYLQNFDDPGIISAGHDLNLDDERAKRLTYADRGFSVNHYVYSKKLF